MLLSKWKQVECFWEILLEIGSVLSNGWGSLKCGGSCLNREFGAAISGSPGLIVCLVPSQQCGHGRLTGMQATIWSGWPGWEHLGGVFRREMSGCIGAGAPQHPHLAHRVNGRRLCSLQTKVDHSAIEASQEEDRSCGGEMATA